jgi:spore maturation protein CgeE
MFNRLKETELEYFKKFSVIEEFDQFIRFKDDLIPDMRMLNFTFIRDHIQKDDFQDLILSELASRKKEGADFLMVLCNSPIDKDILNGLPIVPEKDISYFMYIEPTKGKTLRVKKGCSLRKADTDEIITDGKRIDVQANQEAMGLEFATKRIERKSKVYSDPDSNLDLYVCYDHGQAIGNCEYLYSNGIVKIEDFDIITEYQRKGFGSYVLKKLLENAAEESVEYAYLITDSNDTAKEMYKKCGFQKIGSRTELLFEF